MGCPKTLIGSFILCKEKVCPMPLKTIKEAFMSKKTVELKIIAHADVKTVKALARFLRKVDELRKETVVAIDVINKSISATAVEVPPKSSSSSRIGKCR